MNWHKDLTEAGFEYLESSTRTYGKSGITGSIERITKYNKFVYSCDQEFKEAREVFCLHLLDSEQNMSLSKPFNNIEELKQYTNENKS